MYQPNRFSVKTCLGAREVDSSGSPVGVVRLVPDLSYAGVGHLLQSFINDGDQAAWSAIVAKIDYTFANLHAALAPVMEATGFGRAVKERVAEGRKLLFKPNLVSVMNIDPQTHGPDGGSSAATEWSFVAALMRWFHERLGISYHEMCLGEATPATFSTAGYYSLLNPAGRRVTPEATIEGRSGDFYGGWGFYFARQYLAERLASGRTDDPMLGYEESVSGGYVAPGRARSRLMVYDLNRLADDESKAREIAVPDGVNFRHITLHKVVVGGDPADAGDRELYPGCVLVNVPRLKVHAQALLTNAVKNLGIGLFPMEAERGGPRHWQYAFPPGAMPGVKGDVPHQVWVAELDTTTGLPRRDHEGNVVVRKTGGLSATMVDVLAAVNQQAIPTLHVVDAVEAINLDHTGFGKREPEGLALVSLDPVAVDLLCARYLFANVPLAEAERVGIEDGCGGLFPQRVPVPTLEGEDIVTRTGYDCPLARDRLLALAERRGLGQRLYHIVGRDATSERPLVSVGGRLGTVADGVFAELFTKATYYATQKVPWDLQETTLRYLEAVDQLTGSTLRQAFLAALDEDGDGAVSYEEAGKKGIFSPRLFLVATGNAIKGTEPLGYLRGPFTSSALMLKYRNAAWNSEAVTYFDEHIYSAVCLMALRMSQAAGESPDLFQPTLTWGKGKWPSYRMASFVELGIGLHGPGFPARVGFGGLYGLAFRYADATQNGSGYAGKILSQPEPEAIARYAAAVTSGLAKPLAFTLYVPSGYATVGGQKVPNVEETSDPLKVFTTSFAGGAEVWPSTRVQAEVQPNPTAGLTGSRASAP